MKTGGTDRRGSAPGEPSHPDTCLHRLIEAQVARAPEAIALASDEEGILSYGDLNRRANQLAHRLRRMGVAPGQLVGVCVERSLDLVVALLAVLKAGGAYVPLDPSYPPERLRFMAEDAEATILLVQRRTAGIVPAGSARTVILDEDDQHDDADETPPNDGRGESSEDNPAGGAGPDDLAYVIFTSGSTGRPKGAMNTHANVVASLAGMQEVYGLTAADRFLHKTPFSFDPSVCELFWPLMTGARVEIAGLDGHRDGAYQVEAIRRRGITIVQFVPSMLSVFLEEPGVAACTSLKHVTCGGEVLSPHLCERFHAKLPGARLRNTYGPTETAVAVTVWSCTPDQPRDPVPIGRPMGRSRVHILDENGNELPAGQAGQLCIGGPQVGRGYLRRPALTAEKFVPDPFADGSGGEAAAAAAEHPRLYLTGDRARVTADGVIEYLGRIDQQVKIRGIRVEPGEIESVLREHPAVRDAAVVLRPDGAGEPRVVGYLVGNDQAHAARAPLREWLSSRLPEVMVPAVFVWLAAFPVGPTGKLDHAALPPPPRGRPDTGRPPVPARSERERALCEVFAGVLELDAVGAEDNFFDLGGNSLLSMRVLAALRAGHGIDVPVARFFQHPTPRALDIYLGRAGDAAPPENARMPATRIASANRARDDAGDDAVAVVGLAGRFPGAGDVATLWKNVRAGIASLTRFTDETLDASLPSDLTSDPAYVRARGIVDGYDEFDAGFFGLTPREAILLEPAQRKLLEVAWEALEHAGYVPETIPGIAGVFAGAYGTSYMTRHLLSHTEFQGPPDDIGVLLHNDKDYVATRIAHRLNLTGPAVSIHTACSTSLVAITEAFWSLKTGQCDLALAGGASIICPPMSGYLYQDGAILSADGFTRSFDADASGTTFSDGVALVVLRRLRDAVAGGDTIYGVIRGAAINNDGAAKASFMAPSVEGQAAVIRTALQVAGVDPRSIGYVEAHGTATPIGDPIEVEALTEVFGAATSDRQFCALSSLKSNIGHLVAAAGAAGVIKAVLSLTEAVIPATAHFQRPNPKIDFSSSPFFVTDRLLPWPASGGTPRRAAVSSFGVGGTNAHVVLEEAPPAQAVPSARPRQLLPLSGRTAAVRERAAQNLSRHLTDAPATDLADTAFTLATGRRAFPERGFVVARDAADAAAALIDPARFVARRYDGHEPKVAFLFPGQGAQAPRMGRQIYRVDPVFRTVVDECAARLLPELGRDLRELIHPVGPDLEQAAATLRDTRFTQPALFTVEYAMAQVLLGWGIRPEAMVGHSIGEFVCAVVAGVMSLQDALRLVAARGRMMQSLPVGSMLSVRRSAAEVAERLPPALAIASDNGPSLCVVAGPSEAVELFRARLESEGVVSRELVTSHAFHSSMMDPVVGPFAEIVRTVPLAAPRVPFVSTLTGTWITPEEATDPQYWAAHLRKTVRYREAVAALLREPGRVLVEVGPRSTLTTMARQQATNRAALVAVATLGDSTDDDAEWDSLLRAVGLLWTAGVPVDWRGFYGDERRRRVPLPVTPFERQRHWVEAAPLHGRPRATGAAAAAPPVEAPAGDSSGAGPSAPVEAAGTATPPSAGIDSGTRARRPRLLADLRRVIEEVSGVDLPATATSTTFLELGLDSLALTQVAQQLQKALGLKISFRELMETHSTLERLGEHMDRQLPPDRSPPASARTATLPPARAPATPSATPAGPADRETIKWVIDQQMALMQQQLQLLEGKGVNATAAAAPVPFAPSPASAPTEPAAPVQYDVKKAFGAMARITTTGGDDLTPHQRSRLDAFIRRYVHRTRKSKDHTQAHRAHLSDPRAVTGFRPALKEIVYQIVIDRSRGCRVWDLDGNEYIDTLSGFGASLFGWQPPFVTEAVIEQIQRGHEIGPMHPLAGEVAALVCELTGFDRAAFCNTGSEAVMGCMRIARTVTGRSTIAIFTGSYHGIFDEVIVRGTKSLRSLPAAPGIMPAASQNVLVLDYGTPESMRIIRERAGDLAAVMVEPVQSRAPDLIPREFLQELRQVTDNAGALFIFDEVITGFRSHLGGAQALFGIKADLASYGKVIGGGYPFGVIAGKRAYMDALDGGSWQYGDDSAPTVGVTYFAGTFCRHPLALAAAKASLLHLKAQGPRLQETLTAKTTALAATLNAHFAAVGVPITIKHFASLWKVYFTEELLYPELLFYLLRDKGIHILDLFPCFLTTAHTDADIAAIVDAFKEAVAELQAAGFLPAPATGASPALDASAPPVPGARLGRDADGNPTWFVPDPQRPGRYLRLGDA
ncbi:MAG: amino acid adenylation domain-containing protein [Pseudomonadota bacterium]